MFTRLINRRKISDYKMQLAIATNPNSTEPNELWNLLDQQERQNEGKDYVDAEFDQVAFDAFKSAIQSKGGNIVIKG